MDTKNWSGYAQSILIDYANSSGYTFTYETAMRVNFVPKPDITAYELALAIPFFHGQQMSKAAWEGLGDAQRHWQSY